MSQKSNQHDPLGDMASLTVQGAVVGIASSAAASIPNVITLATLTTAGGAATVITAPVAGLVTAGMAIAYGISVGTKIAKACDRLQNGGSETNPNAQRKPGIA